MRGSGGRKWVEDERGSAGKSFCAGTAGFWNRDGHGVKVEVRQVQKSVLPPDMASVNFKSSGRGIIVCLLKSSRYTAKLAIEKPEAQ